MARLTYISAFVLLSAAFYQLFLKDVLFVTLGIGRLVQPIENFPYSCRRIEHERLAACEDIWLDDEARVLYAACTGIGHRMAWNAAMNRLNVSGRRPGGSELMALDIDSPGADGLFGMRSIQPAGYFGATGAGDETLDLVGFDVEVIDASTIQFYLINQRPPVDVERKYIDPTKFGANVTVDVFDFKRGQRKMQHLRTVLSTEVWSPNRVAVIGDGAFVVSNDHSTKVGLRKQFDPIVGGGNVAYCSPTGVCHGATTINLKFPNGITKGKNGLIYVPSSVDGKIRVFELQTDKMLKHIDTIEVKMPIDNLAADANGDLFVAAIPDMAKAMATMENPYQKASPSTIFRVRNTGHAYQVEKILEDGEARVMSFVTTARHDAKTGRLFLSGVFSPYLVVCNPK
ncbi:calcium-dependent phosphotriesterase [Melanomma pulvis-pyrius CBS 109.77]|uniref:Calcium-dependent phosphotriesterase n=1 Tax=Melanomma pulvis-pyrius CBS 109.77 TaxID=1314802 RepID=A0A6A6WZB6_9PLEO|nr:calcium-dependent phosphotriesterase [Melanomma pulvis-pyrius CBS 109.77]